MVEVLVCFSEAGEVRFFGSMGLERSEAGEDGFKTLSTGSFTLRCHRSVGTVLVWLDLKVGKPGLRLA